ncbi:MAG: FtsX-like permease family protein [Luteitalea sp.]|nr:FtsX-like permease family protein [Luteitalea sp.]
MKRIRGIRSLFRFPTSERDVPNEVEDEIAFHLEERTRELRGQGMEPGVARAKALREFGDVTEARTELAEIGRRRVRQTRRSNWWSDLRQDIRYAWRALLRSPRFTVVAVLTLALGIGATTAIYTVVDAVLLRPLTVSDPERLVVLQEQKRNNPPNASASPANFFDWQKQARSFSSMAYFTQAPLNLTGQGEPQEAQVQPASANLFSTLGVQPLLGRTFRPEEDAPQDEEVGSVAVLGYALWQSRYGGDPAILGRTIWIDDLPAEVVGVMGPDFQMLDSKPDLWIPLGIVQGNRTSMGRFVRVVARLRPGVTLEQAQGEMRVIARRLEAAYPEFNTRWGVAVLPARERVVGDVRPALLVLMGAVAMLLLIACTNVASLLLGQASTRRQEIAMRLSLGATRGRVVRQVLTESLVLSVLGGVIGLAAATIGTRALVRSLPESVQFPRLDGVTVDWRVLTFALVVIVLTGLLFGLAPALFSSRTDLQGSLRDASHSHTAGRGTMLLRNSLVVTEVALALMLLVGAGLLLRSFQKLQAVDTGMRPEGVLTLRMSLGSEAYDEDDASRAFLARLLTSVQRLPNVQAVGMVSHLPLSDEGSMGHTAYRADRPAPAPGEKPGVDTRIAGGDYFAAQGIRLLRGRTFDERDHAGSANVLVINEALGRQQFPGEDPLGKRLTGGGERSEGEIIGVVEDVRARNITDEPKSALYRPFVQVPDGTPLHLVIRTAGDPIALAGAVREEVHRLDPSLPVANVRTMEAVVADATARSRLSSYLLAAFAALALFLAAIGLYGILSHVVVQRRSEIGVRVALGADRRTILQLFVGQGMRLTAAGVALGLVGALALTHLLRSLLFGVTTTDAPTFVVVPLLLVAVAALACYLPASRAARLDPATTLRAQ